MRHSSWEYRSITELEHARFELARTAARAGRSERDLVRRLPPGAHHSEIVRQQLARDADLRTARERFRADHRRHMAALDDCAGYEEDLEMARADH